MNFTPKAERRYAGYDLTLSCSIAINATVTNRVGISVTWVKDGVSYQDNWDSRISVTPVTLTNSTTYTTTLQFAPLSSADSGSYTCIAVLTAYTGASLVNATDTVPLAVESEFITSYI